jgi:hypothetical protein
MVAAFFSPYRILNCIGFYITFCIPDAYRETNPFLCVEERTEDTGNMSEEYEYHAGCRGGERSNELAVRFETKKIPRTTVHNIRANVVVSFTSRSEVRTLLLTPKNRTRCSNQKHFVIPTALATYYELTTMIRLITFAVALSLFTLGSAFTMLPSVRVVSSFF